jgi:formylglycine-generating enzyme
MSIKLSTKTAIALSFILLASVPSIVNSQAPIEKVTSNNVSANEYPEMVLIPAGKFKMGSPNSEPDRNKWEKQKVVSVAEFYLGKDEVTFSQYKKFAEATGFKTERERNNDQSTWRNPTENKWTQGPSHPALCIDWQGASEYCKWISKATGENYRLPTEVEWEYACRAGSTTAFNVGKKLTTKDANFRNYNGSF